MKKLFFTLLAFVAFSLTALAADPVTYIMTSYNNKVITDDHDGTWNASAAASTSNQLPATPTATDKSGRGVAFYQPSGVTVTSEESFTNVTSITLDVASNGGSTTLSVKVGDDTFTTTQTVAGSGYHEEMTFTSASPASGKIEIKMTNTSKKTVWLGAVTVTTKEKVPGEKDEAGLAFNPKAVTCYVDEIESVAFTKVTTADVTFANSDPTVAEYEDGIVYAYKVGSCTITATSEENNEYKAGEATLTINVTVAPVAVMIVSKGTDDNYYAMSCEKGSTGGSLEAVKVDVVNGKVVLPTANKKLLWIVADGAVQSVSLKDDDKDSYISFNKTTVSFAASASTDAWTMHSDGYLVNGTRAFITDQNIYFKTYDVSNIFKENTTYGGAGVPMEYVIAPAVEVAAGDYVSFSSDKAVAVPEGITAYYLSSVTATDATLTAFEGVIPANAGVILRNEGEEAVTFYVVESTATPASLDGNLLVATDGTEVAEGNYILAQPAGKEIGFYPLDADYALAAGHAYLPASAVPSTPSGIKIKFGESGVADIVAEGEGDGQMYNMLGQKVNANYKGIVIKNGKKYINK